MSDRQKSAQGNEEILRLREIARWHGNYGDALYRFGDRAASEKHSAFAGTLNALAAALSSPSPEPDTHG